jgi:hypothetical protein
MATSPHQIIDKNGKRTTVHRRDDAMKSVKKTLPAQPAKVQPYPKNFISSKVVTDKEARAFKDSFALAKKFHDTLGWDMAVIASDWDGHGVIKGDVVPPDAMWYGMAAVTPEGLVVTAYGAFEEDEYVASQGLASNERFMVIDPDDFDALTEDVEEYGNDGHFNLDVTVSKIHNSLYGTETMDWHREVDDADEVVVNGETFPIAIEGYGILACLTCGTFLDPSIPSEEMFRYVPQCQNCNDEVSIEQSTCAIRESSLPVLDDDTLRDTVWYHSTINPNWDTDIKTSADRPVVHLGTKEAAIERIIALRKEGQTHDIHVFEVKVTPTAPISAALHFDNNSNQPQGCDEMAERKDMTGDGVNRYLNRYENQGSISLMANPQAFEVVGRSVT